jgi:hypothetical protein
LLRVPKLDGAAMASSLADRLDVGHASGDLFDIGLDFLPWAPRR